MGLLTAGSPPSVSFINGTFEDSDIRQVAVFLGIVEAVADDELVGDLGAAVIRYERYLAA